MKYPIAILLIALLTGCTSLRALQDSSSEAPTAWDRESVPGRAGTTLSVPGTSYPAVAVTPEGGHAIVMPPCGNTAVVVNPDGSHSIATINGATATIVTP